MNQNMLYVVIGALAVVVIALGIYVYRENTKPEGVELRIDDFGHLAPDEMKFWADIPTSSGHWL